MKILNFLNGYKTFIVGICAIVYGINMHNSDAIIIGCGLLGIRQSVYTLGKQVVDTLTTQQNTPTITPEAMQ